VGLLVSAFGPWRRSKAGLITLGLMLSLGLFVTTAVDDRGGFDRSRFSDQTYRPLTEAEIQNSYRVLMGESTLDLSQVDFSSSDSTEIDIEVTMGNFEVLVPRDAAIRYNGETSFGSVSVFGARDIGDRFYYPGGGAGAAADEENPDLILNLDVQFGNAEVRRVG
jgi:predicted membrane protein